MRSRAQNENYALPSALLQPPNSARFQGGCFISCYGIGSPDSDGHGRLLKRLGSAGLEASTGLPDDSFPGDRPQGFSSQAWAVNVSPSGCNSRPFPLYVSRETTIADPFAAPYLVAAGTTPDGTVPTGPQNRLDKAVLSRDHRCSLTQWNLATALIGDLHADTPGLEYPGMRSRRNGFVRIVSANQEGTGLDRRPSGRCVRI